MLWMYALIGAYQEEGHRWLKELRKVLTDNVNFACEFIDQNLEGVTVSKPQGTYMLFIDCKDYCQKHDITLDTLYNRGIEYGVLWQDGRPFHGEYNIRLNLALPHSLVVEAFDRMKQYIFAD